MLLHKRKKQQPRFCRCFSFLVWCKLFFPEKSEQRIKICSQFTGIWWQMTIPFFIHIIIFIGKKFASIFWLTLSPVYGRFVYLMHKILVMSYLFPPLYHTQWNMSNGWHTYRMLYVTSCSYGPHAPIHAHIILSFFTKLFTSRFRCCCYLLEATRSERSQSESRKCRGG